MLASGSKSQRAAIRSLLNRFRLFSADTFPQAQGGAGKEGRGREGGAGTEGGRGLDGGWAGPEDRAGARAEVGRGKGEGGGGEGGGANRHPEAGRACPRAAFPIFFI